MSESIPRFPLEWPLGWVRTKSYSRKSGAFSMTRDDRDANSKRVKRVTAVNMAVATGRLEMQLDKLGAKDAVLSTNVTLNLRGVPRGDENPADPGAAVYFKFRGKATVLACDAFLRVADNIAALAAHIDALRRIERYGVGTIEQALAGYKALPADSAADWRMVLFGVKSATGLTVEDVQAAYRARAREVHPDHGGSNEAMSHLNRARDYALAELTQ